MLSVISFLQLEVSPIIHEQEKIINSFPYLMFAESSAYIFIIWSVSALIIKIISNLQKLYSIWKLEKFLGLYSY